MRRIVTTLVLGLCLLGCASKAPPGDPIQLLTGAMPFDADECPDSALAQLLVDPQYGTALAEYGGSRTPVMWRPGFTGRRVASEVVVLDPTGNVVAITGNSYRIAGNYLYQTADGENGIFKRGWVGSTIGVDMFYACDFVRPEGTGQLLPAN
jgi:hypothetical protein